MRPRRRRVTSSTPARSRNTPRICVPVEPIGLPRTSSSPRPRYPPWAPPSTSAQADGDDREPGTERAEPRQVAARRPSARRRRRRPPAARRRSRRRRRRSRRRSPCRRSRRSSRRRAPCAMNRPNASSPRPISSGCWCAGCRRRLAARALLDPRRRLRAKPCRTLFPRHERDFDGRYANPARVSRARRAARPAAGRTRRRRCPRRRARSAPSRRARAGRSSSGRGRAPRRSRPSRRRGASRRSRA